VVSIIYICIAWKSKKQKKEFLEVALPSAMTIGLGKENLKKRKKALALGKEIFF
jgi:hypothetical protein